MHAKQRNGINDLIMLESMMLAKQRGSLYEHEDRNKGNGCRALFISVGERGGPGIYARRSSGDIPWLQTHSMKHYQ